jgi:hypothetical protein
MTALDTKSIQKAFVSPTSMEELDALHESYCGKQ